ncbi:MULTISPECIES: DUF3168 domain-containing protein [Mameliella]|uniref:DUF3168 domain-containing protein n=1 Tax=Mameliella TaxID=1434019 RepID=UPI000B530697|nr:MULTISPECIES: DUF3168 domain-containing protein [Mameliella]MCR9274492.1 DUF3168 domain-containing protein [Paracoccaceae bacterium]OWV63027.1 hypothetical protein CDZ98_02335 [Mameliella alba]
MSYAVASALQASVFTRLQGDAALSALVGADIYDALPTGNLPPIYVALGPETARDAGDQSGSGAWHRFVVSVVTSKSGFQTAKDAAAAISDALHGADLMLARGRLVGLWFEKAKAKRESRGLRCIDLTFRARVEDASAP